MKKLLILLFFTTTIFTQTVNDSIQKSITESDLFSDYDIALIDSLLLDSRFKSPLYNSFNYNIDGINNKDISDVSLSSEV